MGLYLGVKITHLVIYLFLCVLWVWRFVLVLTSFWIFNFFMPLYFIFFTGILTMCDMRPFDYIVRNFPFLYKVFGRGCVDFFMGTIIMFGYDGSDNKSLAAILSYVCGITLWVLGAMMIIGSCCGSKATWENFILEFEKPLNKENNNQNPAQKYEIENQKKNSKEQQKPK
ncbi:hypothetical protein PPERSA_05876 [Pseudocohnilembus persalinus]|uniref:Uncharacterized protein n=1 Tax=Pseudocohnilembus persalinus TaxID=266149 RepID=A0A0V0R403_PSEPJ|nr:hypothetical protein PPERSA_05876 [Pseudocohnilembus persalinus]|eukprot:KRX09207.1 hypothetical protein PPERSA_05876 [Pseudocohnilembus persalinus]